MTFAARAQVVVENKDMLKKRPAWAAQLAKLGAGEGNKVRQATYRDDTSKAQARLQSELEAVAAKVCFDLYHVLEVECLLCRSLMTATPRRSCSRRLAGFIERRYLVSCLTSRARHDMIRTQARASFYSPSACSRR